MKYLTCTHCRKRRRAKANRAVEDGLCSDCRRQRLACTERRCLAPLDSSAEKALRVRLLDPKWVARLDRMAARAAMLLPLFQGETKC